MADGDCRLWIDEEETPGHILNEFKKRRQLGSHIVDINEIPSMKPLRILEFIKIIDLEKDL